MSKQREELDSALEALQNEMRETISKLDPKEMVWIHQPPGMPPILCKEPVVGAVPVYALSPTLKITEPKPNARKPLTDDEISAIVQSMSAHTWDAHMLARLIEKAHGIGE